MSFKNLPSPLDLPALERETLARWQKTNVFERSLEQTSTGPRWVFYEGPPTANGMPGVHHVEARVFKDVFPRFKTMKGFHVPRKAGWDCHGLPVEVAVEKELGISGKKDIEAYGVAEFNARCRESVLRHVGAFEEMTERMGYWVNTAQAYRTMDPDYVESVWWSLKTIFEKGLLVRDHRISPYCPRCGTPLSDHELGQQGGYETVVDTAVTVRFPLSFEGGAGGAEAERLAVPDCARSTTVRADHPLLRGADLLAWTTTPWTLVSTTAVAVNPSVTYVIAARGDDKVVVAEARFADVLGSDWRIVDRLLGSELAGLGYRRPFELVDIPDGHRILTGSFVTTEDGTGLVQMAPAFGADDYATIRAAGMSMINPIRPDGRFESSVPLVGGLFFKDADALLVADLAARGLLFDSSDYEHRYPHCWRCHTRLLYYALPAWYIKTSAIKSRLLSENARTNWFPETIKNGRYGEWLRNNVDWSLSRTRYWGTPLPLWVCPDDHVTAVGSLLELSSLAGSDLSGLDPHRPFVDSVSFGCPRCGQLSRRVPDVIDAWYDSGSMPFAQFGAPWRHEAEFSASYPAQFICEAIDQTRGWFYSLMAVGTLVFDRSSYENVVCLGHILAEDGRKMSKHLGNVIEPLPLMDKHGADALRWYMAAAGQPWSARRVGDAALEEIVRKVLLTYWNTVSFFVMYANASGWSPSLDSPSYAERPLLDRWVLAALHVTVRDVDSALERFDTSSAGRSLASFVDDLSNWYVRRSRRRFWEGPSAGSASSGSSGSTGSTGGSDGGSAFATLYECLETLTRLMAPFVPFLTDYVWDVLRGSSAPDSVHLASWPVADASLVDDSLLGQMALVRRLVELGRAARASSLVRTRQPLGRALVGGSGWAELPSSLRSLVADELNVRALEDLSGAGEIVEYSVKPNYRALGGRFGKSTPSVASAIQSLDPGSVAGALRSAGTFSVLLDGSPVSLGPDDVIVTERPREGWAVESGYGDTVALDLALTPSLVRAGLAREVVRLIQDARKSAGLDISDRIDVWWSVAASASGELAEALRSHAAEVAGEVLASSFVSGEPPSEDVLMWRDEELGLTFWLRRSERRAE